MSSIFTRMSDCDTQISYIDTQMLDNRQASEASETLSGVFIFELVQYIYIYTPSTRKRLVYKNDIPLLRRRDIPLFRGRN